MATRMTLWGFWVALLLFVNQGWAQSSPSQPGQQGQPATGSAAFPSAKPAPAASPAATPTEAQPEPAAPAPGSAAKKPAAPAGATQKPAAAPAGNKPAAKPATAEETSAYVVRLRDLESRVEELKEQIRRSHARLSLLSESVLASGVGGAQAEIVFRNQMSNAFRVADVLVVLDGAVQYSERGEEAPHARQNVTPIFDGTIPPGDHTIQVVLKLRGHGYGIFSYLRGYEFPLTTSHSFTIRQGQAVRIEVVAWEKGGPTTPFEERPAVRFVEQPLQSGRPGAP